MQLAKPEHFRRVSLRVSPLLIFPMRCDTELSTRVHVICANLNLNSFSIGTNHCGVQGLIQIEFWHCNVIFKSTWDWAPPCVDRAKHCIAISHIVDQDSNSNKVIDVIEISTTNNHLLIHAKEVLFASCHSCVDGIASQILLNAVNHFCCQCIT
ncbi:unannotated protein [freshwater metagenome]|uniref:Unannotated protein n=1 Tax=freshwater metagenome TaxID=449393 RepID=A0A6J7NTM4_9ZZZZ